MKNLRRLFFLFTLLNAVVFLFRDHFQYRQFSTYEALYKPCDTGCKKRFAALMAPYQEDAQKEARQLVSAKPSTRVSTLTKLKQISQHLYSKFGSQHGYPGEIIQRLPPLEQYKMLSSDTAQKLWCGTWAQQVSFFSGSHDVISRHVEIIKPGDHHVLNECYLPERQQWVLIDLTHNIALAEKDNRLLNTQDFVQALANPGAVLIHTGSGTKMRLSDMKECKSVLSYYQSKYDYYYYQSIHTDMVYSAENKLKRYFLPVSWYEIFTPVSRIAFGYYVKIFLIAVWILLGSLILVKQIHD